MVGRKLLAPFSAIGIVLSAPQTGAQEVVNINRDDKFGLVRNVSLQSIDRVEGGCWTNIQSTKSRIKLLFEQSEVGVLDEPFAWYYPGAPFVSIEGLGLRTGGICAVHANFEVGYWTYWNIYHEDSDKSFQFSEFSNLFESTAVFSNSSNTNDQLADFFEGAASEFLSKVIAARRSGSVKSFFESMPLYGADPTTKSEWDEMSSSNE